MRVLLIGLGSIGTRYSRILHEKFGAEITLLRSSPNLPSNEAGFKEVYNWDDINSKDFDAAFITNPTSFHVETAIKCAERGIHCLIEKPLSHSMEKIDIMIDRFTSNNVTCYVAYCLRFHPVVIKLRELLSGKSALHVRATCSSYLPGWRQGKDHLQTYSAQTEFGGGVLLDLSHELDYLTYLLGPVDSIKSSFGKVGDVTVDSEDFADLLVKFKNGTSGNVHVNYLSMHTERRVTIVLLGVTLEADLVGGELFVYSDESTDKFSMEVDMDMVYEKQIRYFLQNRGNKNIMNGPDEARSFLSHLLETKSEGSLI